MKSSAFFLFLLLSLPGITTYAQTPDDRSTFDKERQQIQQELKEIQKLYDAVKGQKKQTLSQLSVLNSKISTQEKYIGTISKEIKSLGDDIYLSELEIYRLNKQLDTLKTQYARTVVYAYRNRSSFDYINFIFSASSFNDAIKRISYLKSYREYREKQVEKILRTQEMIAQRKSQQEQRKGQKSLALDQKTTQTKELSEQQKEKSIFITQLKGKEKEFEKQIAVKKKRDRELQSAISAIVKREVELAKKEEEERKKASGVTTETTSTTTAGGSAGKTTASSAPSKTEAVTPAKSYLDLNATDVALNSSFEVNKTKLPWPVDNGVVILKFGINKIENTLLTIDNPGVTIATPSAGLDVKAVFEGEVRGVFNLGDGMGVTIRHGKYFTTYSNLSSVTVEKGTMVTTGQVIGKVGQGEEGVGGQIDFLMSLEVKKIDPQLWLRK